MAVRLQQATGGLYFITFTCYRWRHLFEITRSYDAVYKWFDYLYKKGAAVCGYVVMPNHLHVLLYLPSSLKSVNAVVGNAKRFMAYEIIKRLEAQKEEALLQELYDSVKSRERTKGQRHKVFEESFDAKLCLNREFVHQKPAYMHHNPVSGRWSLVQDFSLYAHSSAGFYYATGANEYKSLTGVEEVKQQ